MAESTNTESNTETESFFHRPLKTLDVGQIESAAGFKQDQPFYGRTF